MRAEGGGPAAWPTLTGADRAVRRLRGSGVDDRDGVGGRIRGVQRVPGVVDRPHVGLRICQDLGDWGAACDLRAGSRRSARQCPAGSDWRRRWCRWPGRRIPGIRCPARSAAGAAACRVGGVAAADADHRQDVSPAGIGQVRGSCLRVKRERVRVEPAGRVEGRLLARRDRPAARGHGGVTGRGVDRRQGIVTLVDGEERVQARVHRHELRAGPRGHHRRYAAARGATPPCAGRLITATGRLWARRHRWLLDAPGPPARLLVLGA